MPRDVSQQPRGSYRSSEVYRDSLPCSQKPTCMLTPDAQEWSSNDVTSRSPLETRCEEQHNTSPASRPVFPQSV
ncbi:hypothetical protein ACRRTK_023287 [Alexandromys fortis]